MRAFRGLGTLSALLLLPFVFACADDENDADPMVPDPVADISATFATALHATGRGMEYWYEAEQGGFEVQTGVPYENLACSGCHTPARCTNCHSTVPGDNTVPTSVCLSCHGRQRAEILKQLPDVHRDAGMSCTECHSLTEMHGNGTAHNSMFEEGARDVTCETCHESVSTNAAHTQHGSDLACATCHMETSVTCVNCHFEAEINEGRKVAYGKFSGWQMLGNFDGKVHPVNFQSVKYGDETFVAYGPFVGHSITAEARTCGECHGNAAAAEYLANGQLKVVEWDAQQELLVPMQGIIPLPPDFDVAFLHDFVTRNADNTGWQFLEEGPDRSHMLFGSPLTVEQIQALAGGAN